MTIYEVRQIVGDVNVYGIADENTPDEAILQADSDGMEIKTFDYDTFWRAKGILDGERSVVYSCKSRAEPGMMDKIKDVASAGNPLIVNSLQKVRAAGVKHLKSIGVNVSMRAYEPGITRMDDLEEMLEEHGMMVNIVTFFMCDHKDIDELAEVLNMVATYPVFRYVTIIDLGEYDFVCEEEYLPYKAKLDEFMERFGDEIELRFGVKI